MGIIIRRKDTGEIFDVTLGFKLEINNTSPLFNELGSKAVTTTIPRTTTNMRLLGFANRLDIKEKPTFKLPVIVSSGSYVREGMLYLSSAYNTEKTFGITIAFNEGIMYESMSNILLTELKNLPVVDMGVTELFEYMSRLLKEDGADEDLSVFQVNFKGYAYEIENGGGIYCETANRVQYGGGNAVLVARKETFIIKDKTPIQIEVPGGYGVTPFIRVWRVLELIFAHYGYTIKDNPFKNHYQLKRLCVLNNTVDAIVGGVLDYQQLMPQVTISDFLQSLYCRFGLKMFFNSNTNEVSFKLVRDILNSTNNEKTDIGSLIDIDYTSAKQVKLSAARSLDHSSTETDTYEDFLQKYNYTIGRASDTPSSLSTGGIYYDATGGLFYQVSTINREMKLISSIHFDWNKKAEGIELEEISSIDECLTMRTQDNDSGGVLYYGIDMQLVNSILTVDGDQTHTDVKNVLAFAYDMGEAYILSETGEKTYQGFKYGSIFPYVWREWGDEKILQEDRNGNIFSYALTLIGEYGAFNNFFKEYDAFLRHSNHVAKLTLNEPVYDLSDIDFSKKRIVDNQPLLFDKADHELDDRKIQSIKVEARTLRLYAPYDLAKEQLLPMPKDIKYMWVQQDDQTKQISDERARVLNSLPPDTLIYQFVSLSTGTVIDDPNPPSATTYWFLPPTERQYQNNETTGQRSHTCTVRYVYTYKIRPSSLDPKWETFTQNIDKIVNYKSYFSPELIS